MISEVHIIFFSAQIIITDSLVGVEGGTLNFTCQAITRTGVIVNPNTIIIIRDGLVFVDDNLSSTSNATHRLFTYGPLDRTDNGDMIQCIVIGGGSSDIVPYQVNC